MKDSIQPNGHIQLIMGLKRECLFINLGGVTFYQPRMMIGGGEQSFLPAAGHRPLGSKEQAGKILESFGIGSDDNGYILVTGSVNVIVSLR